MKNMRYRRLTFMLCALLLFARPSNGYSVLTHEAIIDSAWITHIRPLLLKRYPDATPEQLKEAYSYAYGGCLIQDLGYVPFSSHRFSDLTHYVRSGDFVAALVRESTNLNEFAFALGAMAHYASDHHGHPAVNHATALIYPKLHKKYGEMVTYEDDRTAHLKTEFSIDVVQVARGLYAPDAFHDFIGFRVQKDQLDRAFQDTYGLTLKDVFGTLDLALGTYRMSVGHLIPEMTKVAWTQKKADIEHLSPGVTRAKFVYALPRRRYEKEWGKDYHKPGPGARFMAFLFRVLPKFGPFKALGFPRLPDQAEKLFLKSFEATEEEYRTLLNEVKADKLKLINVNLDTGLVTNLGDYHLVDQAYIDLVDKLSDSQFKTVTPELQHDILTFFENAAPGVVQEKTAKQLAALKTMDLSKKEAVSSQ